MFYFMFYFMFFSSVHFLINSLSCFIQFIKMYILCHVLFISVRGISILLYVTLSPQHVVSISSSATSILSCVLAHISICLKQFYILILIFSDHLCGINVICFSSAPAQIFLGYLIFKEQRGKR